MTPPTSNPFGSMTSSSAGKVDFSAKTTFSVNNNNFYKTSNNGGGNSSSHKKPSNTSSSKNQDEGMMDILNSAVGDFTERPLQIMIREIAKNFLIFTPIGWIILLFILGRKYKGNLNSAFKNINVALSDVISQFSGNSQAAPATESTAEN